MKTEQMILENLKSRMNQPKPKSKTEIDSFYETWSLKPLSYRNKNPWHKWYAGMQKHNGSQMDTVLLQTIASDYLRARNLVGRR